MVKKNMEPSRKKILFVIVTSFDTNDTRATIRFLTNVLQKFKIDRRIVWVIAHNTKVNERFEAPELFQIYSDNRLFDFSAWDDGFKFIKQSIPSDNSDWLLFTNDTIHKRKYSKEEPDFIADFFSTLEELEENDPFILGYIDDFPKPVRVAKTTYDSWIRSNLFLMPIASMNILNSLIYKHTWDQLFNEDPEIFWESNSLLSENFKAYISSWLFGRQAKEHPEYSLRWHSCELPSSANNLFFRKKVMTILCEHHLKIRAEEANIKIYDSKSRLRLTDRWTREYYSQ